MYYMVFIGAAISLVFNIPYALGTLKGEITPNRVSWLLWTIIPAIAFFASLSATGWNWGQFTVMTTFLLAGLIFICSLLAPGADNSIAKVDIFCAALALLALVIWFFTKDANLAIVLSLIADFLAFIPTLIKSIKAPETEGTGPYIAAILNSLTAFFAMRVWNFASLAFPVYLIAVNVLLSLLILRKGRIKTKSR